MTSSNDNFLPSVCAPSSVCGGCSDEPAEREPSSFSLILGMLGCVPSNREGPTERTPTTRVVPWWRFWDEENYTGIRQRMTTQGGPTLAAASSEAFLRNEPPSAPSAPSAVPKSMKDLDEDSESQDEVFEDVSQEEVYEDVSQEEE